MNSSCIRRTHNCSNPSSAHQVYTDFEIERMSEVIDHEVLDITMKLKNTELFI